MQMPDSELMQEAYQALQMGDFREAANILDKLIQKKNAEAMFLRAAFSLDGEKDFDEYGIKLLEQAANLGHPRAAYNLSIRFEEGDGVPQDKERSIFWLQKASDAAYPHALWKEGTMFLYGTGGKTQNIELGLKLIERAAISKSQGALRMLANFYAEGLWGYDKNIEKSKTLSDEAERDDVLLL